MFFYQNEDEWEDFNEPKEKDYSGLKVQSFQTMYVKFFFTYMLNELHNSYWNEFIEIWSGNTRSHDYNIQFWTKYFYAFSQKFLIVFIQLILCVN